jgi:multiple sugar transport system substrate-binding protein
MALLGRRLRRRQILQGGAAAAGALILPGRAPAQGASKPLSGITLNIACWSSPYAKLLTDYIPQFKEATGAKVNYETPSFPIYNQRTDVELSTGGSSYDVLNVTFIYVGRWIGAGCFVPLDGYLRTRKRRRRIGNLKISCRVRPPPLEIRPAGSVRSRGPLTFIWAAPRLYDLFEKAGKPMPNTFDELADTMKAVHMKDGVPGLSARKPLRLELHSLSSRLCRQCVPRPARGPDAGSRRAGSDHRGRVLRQAIARLRPRRA